ncbi:MAG: cytidylate kinase-like family protein [Eubacteriales bacterium]|jgi:cytidylate kinase
MKKFVITIGREFGSLGRPVARRLAELLGVSYYDRDILEATSRMMNLPVSVLGDQEESRKNSFWRMVVPLGTESSDQQNRVFEVQCKIIAKLAATESCVIVGRCADYVLRDDPNAIHVYIYAPKEARLENCINSLGMDRAEARKMIREVDKARLNYHRHYAGYAPGDPKYKHIIINSSLLGVEGTARALAAITKAKFGEADDE